MGFWRLKGSWNRCRKNGLCENKVAVARERRSPHTPFSSHSHFIFVKLLWLESCSFLDCSLGLLSWIALLASSPGLLSWIALWIALEIALQLALQVALEIALQITLQITFSPLFGVSRWGHSLFKSKTRM